MLPKKNRADKKVIEKIFKTCPPKGQEGKLISSPNLTFKFLINKNHNPPRISFIVPKNIAKLAVKRNLLRRVGYSALKKFLNSFSNGIIGVFIFKKFENNEIIIEGEIKKILDKIN